MRKTTLGMFVAGLLLCGFICLLLFPQLRACTAVRNELVENRDKLSQAMAAAASLDEEENRLAALKKRFDEVNAIFRTEMRGGTAIILLGLQSASDRLEIIGLEPGTIKKNGHTLEIPLKLAVQGDYIALLAFINKIENLALDNPAEIRSFQIAGIDESVHEPSSAGDLTGVVRAEMEIVIYSAKTPTGKPHSDEIAGWGTGRSNIFRPTGTVTPDPELPANLLSKPGGMP